ncbi:MAG: hypothetical protein EZS28_031192 [Streblomastix strix]|uniref:Uncharacterized protein n=1 Tax=Streblomastix strix TaxID=222440 RepID=A0A5J4UT66_9EUKA|nr:MAG: hypothetical protein EZS28_031192 [Streblomastix strix]
MQDKIAEEIEKMVSAHVLPSRIDESNMLYKAKCMLQDYHKKVAVTIQFLPVIRRFSEEVAHPSDAYISLFCKTNISTERIAQQFRVRAVLNGDEVVTNQNSEVSLAKIGNKKRISSVSTDAATKMSMMMTVVLGKEQLPPFLVIGNLDKVPATLQQLQTL